MVKRKIRCFFCNKLASQEPSKNELFVAQKVSVGKRHGCICSNCVNLLYEKHIESLSLTDTLKNKLLSIVNERPNKTPTVPPSDLLDELPSSFQCLKYSISSFYNVLTEKVFGQNEALRKVIYTIYHNQMCNFLESYGLSSPSREHALIIGPTGCGKTFLATTVLDAMKIPYAKSDATAITSAGYVGDNVENILNRLYIAAGKNLAKAQNGVIVIDEIDKKARTSDRERDINGLSVQQELLKILEPSTVWINHGNVHFDTSNLTVIMCGAFVGLDDIIARRLNQRQIGFSSSNPIPNTSLLSYVEPKDIVSYGFIEEFVGRIPTPIILEPLSRTAILDIIYSQLNAQNTLFSIKGFSLSVDEMVLNKIVDRVLLHNTGARDVAKELSALLYNAKYNLLESHPNGGICEIDENGNTSISFYLNKSSSANQIWFEGPEYLIDEDEV